MKAQEQKSSMEQKGEKKKRQNPKPEFNRSAQNPPHTHTFIWPYRCTQHVDGRDAILT